MQAESNEDRFQGVQKLYFAIRLNYAYQTNRYKYQYICAGFYSLQYAFTYVNPFYFYNIVG